jgi:hypothetical protein
MTGPELIGVIVIVALIGALIAATVLVCRSLNKALSTLERVHERDQAHVSSVLDRFMSLDFTLFKTYQLSEQVVGQYVPPEERPEFEDEEIVERDADRGGFGSAMGLRALGRREEE